MRFGIRSGVTLNEQYRAVDGKRRRRDCMIRSLSCSLLTYFENNIEEIKNRREVEEELRLEIMSTADFSKMLEEISTLPNRAEVFDIIGKYYKDKE